MEGTFPPRLKNEYESAVERYGPPIVPANFPHLDFQSCCNQWELHLFLPVLQAWAAAKHEAPRHWPVLAFAVDQYVFFSDQLNKDGTLSVADVVDALNLIDGGANKLARGITQFYKMSTALASKDFDRITQIEKLFERLTATAFDAAPSDLENPLARIGADALIRSFLVTVERIGQAAKDEAKNLNRDTLRGKREGKDRALARLVSMAAPIWTSLTTRPASVDKVVSGAPDFVRFVQQLVKISGKKRPSFGQVASAFRSASPRKP